MNSDSPKESESKLLFVNPGLVVTITLSACESLKLNQYFKGSYDNNLCLWTELGQAAQENIQGSRLWLMDFAALGS